MTKPEIARVKARMSFSSFIAAMPHRCMR
jgi:hypothetical protein